MTNDALFEMLGVEKEEKNQVLEICEKLGIEISSYLKMCISRMVQERGVPFSMKLSENVGILAMYQAQKIAKENGISEMSLDEINAEISAARKEMENHQ